MVLCIQQLFLEQRSCRRGHALPKAQNSHQCGTLWGFADPKPGNCCGSHPWLAGSHAGAGCPCAVCDSENAEKTSPDHQLTFYKMVSKHSGLPYQCRGLAGVLAYYLSKFDWQLGPS